MFHWQQLSNHNKSKRNTPKKKALMTNWREWDECKIAWTRSSDNPTSTGLSSHKLAVLTTFLIGVLQFIIEYSIHYSFCEESCLRFLEEVCPSLISSSSISISISTDHQEFKYNTSIVRMRVRTIGINTNDTRGCLEKARIANGLVFSILLFWVWVRVNKTVKRNNSLSIHQINNELLHQSKRDVKFYWGLRIR